jgi:hypothetical protein
MSFIMGFSLTMLMIWRYIVNFKKMQNNYPAK